MNKKELKEVEAKEQDSSWMYTIFNRDVIIEKMEEWGKEAKKRDMTLTEYLDSINPLNDTKKGGTEMNKKEFHRFCSRCGAEMEVENETDN